MLTKKGSEPSTHLVHWAKSMARVKCFYLTPSVVIGRLGGEGKTRRGGGEGDVGRLGDRETGSGETGSWRDWKGGGGGAGREGETGRGRPGASPPLLLLFCSLIICTSVLST